MRQMTDDDVANIVQDFLTEVEQELGVELENILVSWHGTQSVYDKLYESWESKLQKFSNGYRNYN